MCDQRCKTQAALMSHMKTHATALARMRQKMEQYDKQWEKFGLAGDALKQHAAALVFVENEKRLLAHAAAESREVVFLPSQPAAVPAARSQGNGDPGGGAKVDKRKNNKGSTGVGSRTWRTFQEKLVIIEDHESILEQARAMGLKWTYEDTAALHDIASKSTVGKYLTDKDKIIKQAFKNPTFKKMPSSRTHSVFKTMEQELYKLFVARRKSGLGVSGKWLQRNAKILLKRSPFPDITERFRASPGWLSGWLLRHDIVLRVKTKLKAKSFEEQMLIAEPYFANLRRLLHQQPAAEATQHDSIYGRFKPYARVNFDQIPLPFATESRYTYHTRGSKVVAVRQAGSGAWSKRFCTIQACFRPCGIGGRDGARGAQCRVAIIFRGTGRRVKAERKLYDKRVDVYFDEKAWMRDHVALAWAQKTFANFADDVRREATAAGKPAPAKLLVFCDNLAAHTKAPFREAISNAGGLLWSVQ